jgi:hypothetical protein
MNFSISEYLKTEGFDPFADKIAIVINSFELKKNPDWPFRYSEPYIVSMAIDQGGANNPSIDFNILPFPKVRKDDNITFDGQGHLLYGPANPGEFVAYTILFMESDSDIRNLGQDIEEIIKSEALQLGMKELLTANPTFSTSAMLLLKLSEVIASGMKKNKDDELYRRNGTLLRDVDPPFDISKSYEGENDYIKSRVSVVPLTRDLDVEKNTKKIEL